MDRKTKGTTAERELIHKFWKNNIPAIRVAGSGSMRYASPDIIAGTPLRKVVIECKNIGSERLYIPKEEIEELKKFGSMFGAQIFVAVKFPKLGFFFVMLEDMRETKGSYSVDTEEVRLKGLLFEDVLKSFE